VGRRRECLLFHQAAKHLINGPTGLRLEISIQSYHQGMSESVPLAYADIKILEIEGPTVAGHTCKVVRVAAPGVDFDRLFADIASRIESVPEWLPAQWRSHLTGLGPAADELGPLGGRRPVRGAWPSIWEPSA
jgi:hypothetical protein